MKRIILIVLIFIIVVGAGLVFAVSMSPIKELNVTINESPNKPVILVVIDSLMHEPLQKAIQENKAPALSFLINNGYIEPEVVSSYPTMSVTIDSTLLTGTYANDHKVPGLIWFKEDENRLISYGSGLSEMWHNGIKNVALDSVIRLNNEHLSKNVQTIHEQLATRNIQSASINGLLYRGTVKHSLHVPKLISTANLLPKEITTNGPTILSLGALSQYNPHNDRHKFAWKRMGVNNDFTVNELKYFIQQRLLPPFTLAYLPDADAAIHKNGPNDLKAIEKADQSLQEMLNSYPTWQEAIQQATWIILGDSGQSTVKDDKETALIDLTKLLQHYSFWERKNTNGQLAIAINERMAYVYVNDKNIELTEVVNTLIQDERIDFIAWKDNETNYVASPESTQTLTFSPNGPNVDAYNQSWSINGDITILDFTINDQGFVQYNNYPDALARLHGALHSQEGNYIIVDAKPSYEFIGKHSHDHAGGAAHGSLHKVDSVVPLIVAGTDEKPTFNRLVDIKEWIIRLIGSP
ncbi:MAG: alkaline phosphatase family protein [Lysinibacillus sp.]